MRRQKPVDGSSVARSGPPGMDAIMAAAEPPVITFSLATDVGRVRSNNEDFGQAERVLRGNQSYSLWAVADGVGAGRRASAPAEWPSKPSWTTSFTRNGTTQP